MLSTAAERKVGRCADCPPTYDPALFEALRTWRSEVAKTDKVPAFVVFTDATLTAVAEARPTTSAALTAIPGIGARKLEMYGAAVLALVAAADPPMVDESGSAGV